MFEKGKFLPMEEVCGSKAIASVYKDAGRKMKGHQTRFPMGVSDGQRRNC